MINTDSLPGVEALAVEQHGDVTVLVLEYGYGRETLALALRVADEHLEHLQARAQEILAGPTESHIQIIPARVVQPTERERVSILATGQAVIGEPKRFGQYAEHGSGPTGGR